MPTLGLWALVVGSKEGDLRRDSTTRMQKSMRVKYPIIKYVPVASVEDKVGGLVGVIVRNTDLRINCTIFGL